MKPRYDWRLEEIISLFRLPFNDLLFLAHSAYRDNFDTNKVQLSTLLNIKTGGCPENCRYCSQSAHYKTNLQKESLLNLDNVKFHIQKAKDSGATRFCFAAAWRNLHDRDMDYISKIIVMIKDSGMESCASLGMINADQAKKLKEAGLDFYNHNIDTSRDFYPNIVTTRTYEERLETINNVKEAEINLCCGGIIGMGESEIDRAKMLVTLANINPHPKSVPINKLVPIKGTPIEKENNEISNLDFVRTISVARIIMPESFVRLAAGRDGMSEELQALCFFAGANSIFYGEKLLTTPNTEKNKDQKMLQDLGAVF